MYLKQLLAFVLGGLLVAGNVHAEYNHDINPRYVIEKPNYVYFPKIQINEYDLPKLDRMILELLIDEYGEVHKVMLVKSSGMPKLDVQIIEQIKARAHFKPLVLDGKPIASYVYQIVEFKDEDFVATPTIPEYLQYIPVGTPSRNYTLLSLKRACGKKLDNSLSVSVLLSAYISKNGEVLQLAVKQPAPDNAVNKAAVEALSRCLFEPVLEDGQAIAYTTDIPMYFYRDYANRGSIKPAPELLKHVKAQGEDAKVDEKLVAPAKK
jgi:TonB family protein